MTEQSTLDLALAYLREHPKRCLFPITAGKKMPPKIKNNLALASNDPEQIRAWHKKWPGCNWGLSLFNSKSGVIVIDVDTKEGKLGQASFDALEVDHGDFPVTEKVRTPSGGFHLYYEGKHQFAIGKYGFGDGIDSPNYVLIPGCKTSGGTYELEDYSPAAVAPEWFYDVLSRAKKERVANAGESAIDLDLPDNIDWAKTFLTEDAEPAIEGQGGEQTTFKVAASLRDMGISPEMCLDLMLEFYNERCSPPWELEGLKTKITNAYTYANLSQAGAKSVQAEFSEPDDFTDADIQGDRAVIAAQREQRAAKKAVQTETDAPDADDFEYGERPGINVTNLADLPKLSRKVQSRFVKAVAKPNAKASDQVFDRSSALVHLSRNRLAADEKVDDSYHVQDDLLIKSVQPEWLADTLERSFTFFRKGKTKGDGAKTKARDIAVNVPKPLVNRMFAISQDWQYPKLVGTVETPTIRTDGTILDKPGYDKKSRLYFDPGKMKFPPIKDRPTKADALVALEILMKPLVDFPFADEDQIKDLSKSVAVSMLLTAVCRRSLPTAPMFGIDANEANSGKTQLAQVAAILMTGRETAARPFPTDGYQQTNTLAAAFEAGDAVILFDNIDGDTQTISGDELCAALTAEKMQCRRLGGNSADDQIMAYTNALIIGTGNKLTASGDMSKGRVQLICLRTDKPLEQRTFANWPLDAYVIKMRAALVSAALTILRAHWIATEKEPGAYYRFPEWRTMVADAVVWLGLPDPVQSTARVMANDPVEEAQREVMRAWAKEIGERSVTTAEAVKMPGVRKAIGDARGVFEYKLTTDLAARYLKGMVGIKLLGHRMERSSNPSTRVTYWQAVCLDESDRVDVEAPESAEDTAENDFGTMDDDDRVMTAADMLPDPTE